MYNEHDRPSARRMIVTAAFAVAGIAALIAVVSVGFGMLTSHQPSPATSAPAASIQAPATATAEIPVSQPAPASVTTAPLVTEPSTTTSPSKTTAPKPATVPAPAAVESGLGVVVIDAGHEGSPPPGTEPIGPGSSVMKVKLESGATGVSTHVEESQRNLEIALALQKELEARGVKVVMVRTSQNVKISNKQRAEIANKKGAALFVRLHCDSSSSSAVTGVLTLVPGKNWYPAHPIVKESLAAAKLVHAATLAATGAKDRGITSRTDLTGFNWSQVPSVLVEMGLLSNPAEDVKLGTAAYQRQLANGMANGIVAYLKTR